MRPVSRTVIEERRAVQMFLAIRTPQKIVSRISLAMSLLIANGPVRAASRTSVFEDAGHGAVQAGVAIMAYADRIAARDVATIQATAFALSGLIGLVGLWLLVRRTPGGPGHVEIIYAGAASADEEAEASATAAEAEPDRPARLLEAVAAAKAQIAISEAEKKHGR